MKILRHFSENLNLRRVVVAICLAGLCLVLNTGCASLGQKLKSWMGGGNDGEAPPASATNDQPAKYSDQENYGHNPQRKYQRMTKDRFEEEAQVQSNAGSLWVMEGQGSYLVAANNTRLLGDILNVKLEGAPRQQLLTKVKIITKLLEKLEHPTPTLRGPAGAAQAPGAAGTPPAQAGAENPAAPNGQPGAPGAPGAAGAAGAGQAGTTPGDENAAHADTKLDVQQVPTRIVEIEKDGMYRIKGMQPFMIGKREYKVIVTGLVRPEDFNDEGINASKLLESQFDIVSNKKGLSL